MKTLNFVFAIVLAGVLTSCFDMPQLSNMPDGPLQEFYYYTNLYNPTDPPVMEIKLWRVDSIAQGGLLAYCDNVAEEVVADEDAQEDGAEAVEYAAVNSGDTIRVDEAVFSKVYELVKQGRLYRLEKKYSTWLKGDIYGYTPWTLRVKLPKATIASESDGTNTKIPYDDFYAPIRYLENLFKANKEARK